MEIIIKQSIPDAQITWRGREVPASKRKMKLTLSQKGTPRFLLLRATGSISWLFKNRCAEVTFQKHLQHVTHARSCHRPEKTQVCSGPPRAHYFSATGCFKHRAIFFFFFFLVANLLHNPLQQTWSLLLTNWPNSRYIAFNYAVMSMIIQSQPPRWMEFTQILSTSFFLPPGENQTCTSVGLTTESLSSQLIW